MKKLALLCLIFAFSTVVSAKDSGKILLNSVQFSVDLSTAKVVLFCDANPSTPPTGKTSAFYFTLDISNTDVVGLRDAIKAFHADLLAALNSGKKVNIMYNDLSTSGQIYGVQIYDN